MNRELGVSLGGATLAALTAAALPFVGNDYFIGIGFTLLTWIALTEAWILISGMAGYISLGHVAFVGIGAYVAALSWQAFPVWAIVLAAGVAAGALALLVGYPCLRVRGPYFVILTFGLAELLKFVVVNVEFGTGRFGSRSVRGARFAEPLLFDARFGLGELRHGTCRSPVPFWRRFARDPGE